MQMTAQNLNGIDVSALKAFAEEVKAHPDQGTVAFKVATEWKGRTKTVATVSHYLLGGKKFARHFEIHADEPTMLGGDTAPNPQELLLAALNACMSIGYAANAAVMGITLEKLEIESEGELDLRDSWGLIPPSSRATRRFAIRSASNLPLRASSSRSCIGAS
jgi:uncharacterized OsmC-like protein